MSLSAKDKELVEDWAAEPKPVAQTKPKPKLEPKPSIKPEPQPVDPERTICFQPEPKEKRNRLRSPALAGTRC